MPSDCGARRACSCNKRRPRVGGILHRFARYLCCCVPTAIGRIIVVMERKLAAILAADVVEYSRLMEADEAGAFARLKERRQTLVEPELAKHHGCIFKLTGDGLLAEFASVVDAVECAVAVQRGMAERNADLLPVQRIEMRIGI